MMQRDRTAEAMLERLKDLENYPEEHLIPYKEFKLDGETYYFTPGGFLYRKDPWSDEVGDFFCGYLTDEVWHYRTDDGWVRRLRLARGGVGSYGANQGHGFITPEDGGPKAFMRREDIKADEEKLENNDEVSYEAFQGTEDPEARNVSRT